MEQQLELFSISQIRQRNVTRHPQLVMSAEALQNMEATDI